MPPEHCGYSTNRAGIIYDTRFLLGLSGLSFSELVDPHTFRPNLFVLNSASDGIASLSMTDIQALRISLSSHDILAL